MGRSFSRREPHLVHPLRQLALCCTSSEACVELLAIKRIALISRSSLGHFEHKWNMCDPCDLGEIIQGIRVAHLPHTHKHNRSDLNTPQMVGVVFGVLESCRLRPENAHREVSAGRLCRTLLPSSTRSIVWFTDKQVIDLHRRRDTDEVRQWVFPCMVVWFVLQETLPSASKANILKIKRKETNMKHTSTSPLTHLLHILSVNCAHVSLRQFAAHQDVSLSRGPRSPRSPEFGVAQAWPRESVSHEAPVPDGMFLATLTSPLSFRGSKPQRH